MTVNATSNYAPRKSAHEGANGLEQSRPSEAQVPSGAASGMGESVQILDRWYEQGYSAGSGEVARDAGRPALEPYDPLLARENSTFSLLMRVEQLNSETQNAQLVSQQLGINVTDIKRNQLHEDNLKKFDEAIAKIRAAKRAAGIAGKLGLMGKILGFVAALAGVIAAVAAAGATGGLATPVVVFAALALVGASVSLGSEISERHGGGGYSFEDTVDQMGDFKAFGTVFIVLDPSIGGKLLGELAEYAGGDENWQLAANIVGTVLAIGVTMKLAGAFKAGGSAGNAPAAGAGGAGGGDDVAGQAAQVAQRAATTAEKVAKAANMVRIVAAISGAITGSAQATLSYESQLDRARGQEADAERKAMQEAILRTSQEAEEFREAIEKLLTAILNSQSGVSDMAEKADQAMHDVLGMRSPQAA